MTNPFQCIMNKFQHDKWTKWHKYTMALKCCHCGIFDCPVNWSRPITGTNPLLITLKSCLVREQFWTQSPKRSDALCIIRRSSIFCKNVFLRLFRVIIRIFIFINSKTWAKMRLFRSLFQFYCTKTQMLCSNWIWFPGYFWMLNPNLSYFIFSFWGSTNTCGKKTQLSQICSTVL